jgi:hypothetical protein
MFSAAPEGARDILLMKCLKTRAHMIGFAGNVWMVFPAGSDFASIDEDLLVKQMDV